MLFTLWSLSLAISTLAANHEKNFNTIFVRSGDFNPTSVIGEAISEDTCRFQCLLADDDCKAFHFNNVTRTCSFGDFAGIDDPVVWSSKGDGGFKATYDIDADPFPDKHVHVAIIGGAQDELIDVSTADWSTTTTPWFPAWPGPDDQWMPVGMQYGDGFLMCGGIDDPKKCHHLKFGASKWSPVADMTETRHCPGYVAMGKTSLWVTGGSEIWPHPTGPAEPNFLSSTETFHNGKWTPGPKMPDARERHCMVRLDHRRVNF